MQKSIPGSRPWHQLAARWNRDPRDSPLTIRLRPEQNMLSCTCVARCHQLHLSPGQRKLSVAAGKPANRVCSAKGDLEWKAFGSRPSRELSAGRPITRFRPHKGAIALVAVEAWLLSPQPSAGQDRRPERQD